MTVDRFCSIIYVRNMHGSCPLTPSPPVHLPESPDTFSAHVNVSGRALTDGRLQGPHPHSSNCWGQAAHCRESQIILASLTSGLLGTPARTEKVAFISVSPSVHRRPQRCGQGKVGVAAPARPVPTLLSGSSVPGDLFTAPAQLCRWCRDDHRKRQAMVWWTLARRVGTHCNIGRAGAVYTAYFCKLREAVMIRFWCHFIVQRRQVTEPPRRRSSS